MLPQLGVLWQVLCIYAYGRWGGVYVPAVAVLVLPRYCVSAQTSGVVSLGLGGQGRWLCLLSLSAA